MGFYYSYDHFDAEKEKMLKKYILTYKCGPQLLFAGKKYTTNTTTDFFYVMPQMLKTKIKYIFIKRITFPNNWAMLISIVNFIEKDLSKNNYERKMGSIDS